jgi:hypothetical protein
LGPIFLIFDFWGPTYFLQQQKYLEKIVKKLVRVRLEAWVPVDISNMIKNKVGQTLP